MKMVLAEELKDGMQLAQDIFLNDDSASPFVSKGIILNDYVIKRLRKTGVRNVYVADQNPFATGTAGAGHKPASRPALPEKLRNEALYSLENVFNSISLEGEDMKAAAQQAVKQLDSVVDQMVASMGDESGTLININDLKSYDDYTYHHSLSVAVLSIAIGRYLHFNNKELKRLGLSAMMHDIGKTAIPVELIRKTSRLDPQEFDLIKTHSVEGYNSLSNTHLGDEELWRAVLYHHEKLDGTGYPKGMRGRQIPLFSRIISVADVYDALTSNRPYRKPMEPADALEYIMGGTGTAFEFDMVEALVRKIDPYPVGSRIELSDGRVAEVLDNENQMRPVIRMEGSGDILDLFRDRSCLCLVVRRVVPLLATL